MPEEIPELEFVRVADSGGQICYSADNATCSNSRQKVPPGVSLSESYNEFSLPCAKSSQGVAEFVVDVPDSETEQKGSRALYEVLLALFALSRL